MMTRWSEAGSLLRASVLGAIAAAGLGALAGSQMSWLLSPVLLATAALLWAVLCAKAPTAAFTILLGVVVFSSHLLSFVYASGASAGVVRALIPVKDVMAWSLLLILLIRRRRVAVASRTLLIMGAACLTCGLWLLFNSSGLATSTQVASIRGALIPALALSITALLTNEERRRAAIACISMVTLACAYALVELTMPRSFVRDFIGVGRYWRDVKQQGLFLSSITGLPGNFSTSSGFPRLTGSFGDPLSAGEVVAGALVLTGWYYRDLRYPRVTFGLLSVSLALTFTRNGWILAIVGLLAVAVQRRGLAEGARRAVVCLGIILALIAIVPALRAYAIGILSESDSSTLNHQSQLLAGFQYVPSLWGEGWGTGGSVARAANDDAVTFESTYVALLAQIGWTGFSILSGLVGSLVVLSTRSRGVASMPAWVLFLCLLATGLVSENLLTFNAGFFPMACVSLLALSSGESDSPPRRRAGWAPLANRPLQRTGPLAQQTSAPDRLRGPA